MTTAIIKKQLNDYKEFFENLKNNDRYYRLGKTFKTTNNYYFYDLGTGKIFCINKNVYSVLCCLLEKNEFDSLSEINMDNELLMEALDQIQDTVLKENILKAPPITCFSGPQSLALEENLQHNLSQLTLEVTERCNLRCDYCIYNENHNDYHNFTNYDMTFDTAKKAIDFTYNRISDTFNLAFYGGEPLLNFLLIEKCVSYTENLVPTKDINFSMTTNAVLITKDIAEYFAKHNFTVTVSLDGPEDIHNENRKFKDGTGSFKYTVRGLKYLINAYGDRAQECILISMVTSGPNYKEKYDKIQEFFDNTEWLPKLYVSASYVSDGRFESDYIKPTTKSDELFSDASKIDPLIDWIRKKQNGTFNREELFTKQQITQNLHIIHRRDLSEKPMEEYYFNGCCIPGSRRLHITSQGNFLPCERVGTTPFLGNVDLGFNIDNIKKYYVYDFMNEAIKYCNNCWAAHLCTCCYTDCYDDNKINLAYRHRTCTFSRHTLEKSLIQYHEILENDPESLRELNDIVLI